MKPLKFRAWDNINKCFISNVLLDTHGNVLDYELNPIQDVEISYSTGEIDCEGNEIYEGDILEYEPSCSTILIEHYCIDENFYRIESSNMIGNKYQNPELLDVTTAI